MKYIYTFALAMLSFFAACDEDGDKFTVTGLENSEINVSENSVILSLDNANSNVLTFTWTEGNKLLVNDGTVGSTLGNGIIKLQVSADENFSSYSEFSSDNCLYSFMGNDLNSLAKNLGLTVNVASNLYFRISTSMSINTEAVYSETVIVKVTPFYIDMSYAKFWDKDLVGIVDSLYSEQLDGIYEGYIGLSAWQNFWVKEGDGTTWGNIGESGKYLTISSDASAWNFWAPGFGGFYYSRFDTKNQKASFNYIKLSLSGDINADIEYKNSEKKGICTFTTETDNASFVINGSTLLYNNTTGDAEEGAIVGTTALQLLSATDSTYVMGEASPIIIPKAGTYTLYVYANCNSLRLSLVSGEISSDPSSSYSQHVTLYDKKDNSIIIGTLTSATNEDGVYTGVYTGICTAKSYQEFYFKDDNNVNIGCTTWDDVYTVSTESTNNCWFPDNNKSYILTLDIPNGNWSLEEITSLSISGNFNNWDATGLNSLTFDETSQTWIASNVSISDGEWGFYFMINLGWTYALKSPTAGTLSLNAGNNIKLGATESTEYNVSVDLCHATYYFTAVK